jgi:hypothetical protein
MNGEGPGPSRFKYHLELTPAQLKLTHTALRSLLDDTDEPRRREVIEGVLDMLPDEHAIGSIRLDDEIEPGRTEPGPAEPPTLGRDDPPDTVA